MTLVARDALDLGRLCITERFLSLSFIMTFLRLFLPFLFPLLLTAGTKLLHRSTTYVVRAHVTRLPKNKKATRGKMVF